MMIITIIYQLITSLSIIYEQMSDSIVQSCQQDKRYINNYE